MIRGIGPRFSSRLRKELRGQQDNLALQTYPDSNRFQDSRIYRLNLVTSNIPANRFRANRTRHSNIQRNNIRDSLACPGYLAGYRRDCLDKSKTRSFRGRARPTRRKRIPSIRTRWSRRSRDKASIRKGATPIRRYRAEDRTRQWE